MSSLGAPSYQDKPPHPENHLATLHSFQSDVQKSVVSTAKPKKRKSVLSSQSGFRLSQL